MRIALVLCLFLMGCEQLNPVEKYSKEHKVSCEADHISNCVGGGYLYGKRSEQVCDYNYKCSDGASVIHRF